MLLIGAEGRNAGKTELACALIRRFRQAHEVVAVKVTTVAPGGGCPRHGRGCGTCGSFQGRYCLTEETDCHANKDTCRMLAAGASRVLWFRVLEPYLAEGARVLREAIGDNCVAVCESNRLRLAVEPGLFVMVRDSDARPGKPGARAVRPHVDCHVTYDGREFRPSLADIIVADGRWRWKTKATAVIMAGGRSRRMGRDKATLDIRGVPALQYIADRLKPDFSQILISSNNGAGHRLAGIETVPDAVPGKGPLMGIASALRASCHEANFVIACDIPQIDLDLVRTLLRQSRGYDAAIPRTGSQRWEPLFAVYRKTALPEIDRAIAAGRYRIRDALQHCKVRLVDLANDRRLRNLNTVIDYQEFIESTGSDCHVGI